jgi:hypothetical protein
VNEYEIPELSVTIPSYGQVRDTLPFAHIPGAVTSPTVLPLALETAMFVDNALAGRLAFAVVSFAVFASAFSAVIKVFHAIKYIGKSLRETPPLNSVPLGAFVE